MKRQSICSNLVSEMHRYSWHVCEGTMLPNISTTNIFFICMCILCNHEKVIFLVYLKKSLSLLFQLYMYWFRLFFFSIFLEIFMPVAVKL